ncbi:hypothetical protein H2201_007103 [Coniosporium apollinis]|uniref:Alkaline phosphatase n=1 Tax=Coniosporium apollinis TaxID=61459 RepID=A0ABQ9NMH8_9PEZI|nr:hypothetical protein H2201_007103 [Coniosporium apollinis]
MGVDIPKVAKRSLQARTDSSSWDPNQLNFTHGVASGDPYPHSVILWTRISPMLENDRSNATVEGTVPLYNHDTEQYIRASSNPVCVEYRVAGDQGFSDVADHGTAYTTSDIDYTVKVEAKNLEPYTTYYYQFNVCGSNKTSPLGRTKTSPAADDDVTSIGLAVFSCSNYPTGYFNAYGNAARKDNVDYVYPWIPVWDDHEVANNAYRDGSSRLNNTEESFITRGRVSVDQRKMNAVRAYFEWMPIRQVDMDDNLRIWRSFSMGKLFDLIMLDTRNYDRSITTLGWNNNYIDEISNDAGRTLMGSHQENWFYNSLSRSAQRGAVWRIIGNQIIFSRVNVTSWFGTFENPYNSDQWDVRFPPNPYQDRTDVLRAQGYMSNRNRTYQHLYENNIGNNVMLAGDSHANWVSDLVWFDESEYNPATGVGAIGVEFAVTAVSSTGYGRSIAGGNNQSRLLVRDNSELQWSEGYYRGYTELQISPDSINASYFGCPSVATRNPYEISLANFTVVNGANHLSRPVAGGSVESGYLQQGSVRSTNLTLNTETGAYSYTNFSQMFITYPPANASRPANATG